MNWLLAGFAAFLFLWAFAEAYAWPVVPDVALASTVFLMPDGVEVFVAATIAGSIVGGVTAMAAYRSGWRWPLPLVSEHMEAKVARWLDRGPIGLVNQPLTAVPYKVFIVEGARRGFHGLPWAWWTGVFRGARMATVAILTVLGTQVVARVGPPNVTGTRVVILIVGLVIFGAGWPIAWRLWATSGAHGTTRERTP